MLVYHCEVEYSFVQILNTCIRRDYAQHALLVDEVE